MSSLPPAASALPLAQAKSAARKAALAARDALPPDFRAEAAGRLAGFGKRIPLAPGAIVAGFLPIRGEIDPSLLMDGLAARGARLALPVMGDAGALSFRAWAPGDALVVRVWGIREPAADAPDVRPDVVLCPLAAFDKAGRRLGYGRGFYDRALARLRAIKQVMAVGVAFAVQELPEVPADALDQRLDAVLTERGLFAIAAEKR